MRDFWPAGIKSYWPESKSQYCRRVASSWNWSGTAKPLGRSGGAAFAVCHGRNATPAAGAVAPDLRYSELLRAPDTYHTIVDGQRAAQGMPSFKDRLRPGEADAILAYVIKRANDEKAAQEAAN